MDQNLDKKIEFKEKLKNFYINNSFKIYFLLFSLLTGIIVSLSLKYYYEKKNNIISNKYTQAVLYLSKKDYENANRIFDEIIVSKNKFYSILAINTILEKDLIKDKNEILKKFDYVITKINLDKETKNLVIFKKILFIGEDIDESMLLDNLKPIIQSNSVWKSTVSNYIKKYYLSKKEYIKAKEFNSSK